MSRNKLTHTIAEDVIGLGDSLEVLHSLSRLVLVWVVLERKLAEPAIQRDISGTQIQAARPAVAYCWWMSFSEAPRGRPSVA